MELYEIAALSIIFFCAYFIQGIVGFGSALFSLPLSLLLITRGEFVQATLFFTLVQSSMIVIKDYKHINKKQLAIVLAIATIAGIPLGFLIANNFDIKLVKYALAVFILANSSIALYKTYDKTNVTKRFRWYHYSLPLLSGGLQSSFGIGGPPLMTYFTKVINDRIQLRVTACSYWFFLNSIILITYYFREGFNTDNISLIAYLFPAVLLGSYCGNRIIKKINETKFIRFIHISLMFSALFLFI